MHHPLITGLLICLALPLMAVGGPALDGMEVSTGFSMLIYQHVASFQPSFAIESALKAPIAGTCFWQAGVRLGFSPARPEAFMRFLVHPEYGTWQPVVGLEAGITQRARFDAGENLMSEIRRATEKDISPLYVAIHAAPLSLRIRKNWHIRLLDFQFGTHVSHPGRTLRLQVGLLSIGGAL